MEVGCWIVGGWGYRIGYRVEVMGGLGLVFRVEGLGLRVGVQDNLEAMSDAGQYVLSHDSFTALLLPTRRCLSSQIDVFPKSIPRQICQLGPLGP